MKIALNKKTILIIAVLCIGIVCLLFIKKGGEKTVRKERPYSEASIKKDAKALTTNKIARKAVPANSAPRIKKIDIIPRPAYPGDDLKAVVESFDPEEDEVTYTYIWEKNRKVVEGEDGEVFSHTLTKRGDIIRVGATPFDGNSSGKTMFSLGVLVGNRPPEITSQPPESIGEDSIYSYSVTAKDPDGDPLTFSLGSQSPEKMTINPNTGEINWKVTDKDSGMHAVEIIVKDDLGGTGMQKYTLKIKFHE